jgi:hypothetical protein
VTTDADGNYSFVDISAGRYEVSFILTTPTGISSIECTENVEVFLNSFQGVSQDGRYMSALYPVVELADGQTLTEDFIVNP